MKRVYNPDGFTIIHIKQGETEFYKIFGSWAGGFSDGDHWRLSSGFNSLDDSQYNPETHRITIPQLSGSVYHISDLSQHRHTVYNSGILKNILEHSVTGHDETKISAISLSSDKYGKIKFPLKIENMMNGDA